MKKFVGKARKNLSRAVTKAVIDIGSNSFKLRVVRKEGNRLRTLLDTTEVVRLGKGLSGGVIDGETISRGVAVIRRLTRLAAEQGARPRLVGTMALRAAGNAEEFIRNVFNRTGIEVEILSGEEEARLAWLGATMAMGARGGDTAVFDTGGGSTEFVFGKGTRIERLFSAPVGAVSLTEKFFASDPPGSEALHAASKYVRDILNFSGRLGAMDSRTCVIGLGGGVAAMGAVKLALPAFSPRAVNGIYLTAGDIDGQAALYASSLAEERTRITGLPPKRADVVLASACIVRCVMEAMGIGAFRVSINGLRHGLLLEMFKGKTLT